MTYSVEKSVFKIQDDPQDNHLSPELQDLLDEARSLFRLLDECSSKIRILEKELQKIKASFPFKLLVEETEPSKLMPALERHKASWPEELRWFSTQKITYLAWQQDEASRIFRLFLIEDEVECVFTDLPYVEEIRPIEFGTQCIFKRPLLETDLQTRLHYSRHLFTFMQQFTGFLSQHRCAIQTKIDEYKLPF